VAIAYKKLTLQLADKDFLCSKIIAKIDFILVQKAILEF
jgi:hypothetical protein